MTHCPTCGAPLEATVKVYLSDVEINERFQLVSFSLAFGETPASAIHAPESDQVHVYCANDHDIFGE